MTEAGTTPSTGEGPSVLYRDPSRRPGPPPDRLREVLADLQLDEVVAGITAGRESYDLVPLLLDPLDDPADVAHRHEVVTDLGRPEVRGALEAYARGMIRVRDCLDAVASRHYPRERQRWQLDAAAAYTAAVLRLREDLGRADPKATALVELGRYLDRYLGSAAWRTLHDEGERLQDELGRIRYNLLLRGDRVDVLRYAGEADYGDEVARTFGRFVSANRPSRTPAVPAARPINPLEAQILDGVAQLWTDVFGRLGAFCAHHGEFVDPVLARLDREVQVYLGYLEYVRPLRGAGLAVCLPELRTTPAPVAVDATFDLALAQHLVADRAEVVTNDIRLSAEQRAAVVSGPNQGGKTTFARTFGQLHYLAALGLPVPGRRASLLLCDQVLTQFQREEHVESQRGRLLDDLERIHDIVGRATARTVVVLNELFDSTSLADARRLGAAVLRQLLARGALVVYVTFVDELSRLSPQTASLVSEVDPAEPTVRTFRIVARPADGRSYAQALADRHGLTAEALRRRVAA